MPVVRSLRMRLGRARSGAALASAQTGTVSLPPVATGEAAVIITGLDLSLASTGLAKLDTDDPRRGGAA